MLEVDIDVGRLAAFRRDETLKQKIDLGRIDIGDREAIAHGGIRGGTPALTENAGAPRVMHDVVDGEKIGRVIERGNEREFLLERVADLLGNAVWKTPSRAFPGQFFQMGLRCLALRNRLVRIFVSQLVEGEAARFRDLDGARQRVLIALEEARHLGRRFQMPLGIGFEAKPCVGKRAFLADAGEHVLKRAAHWAVIQHRAGGDERDARALGHPRETFDPRAVIAAIGVARGEVERRARRQRVLDAPELRFERTVMPAKAGIQ